MMKFEYPEMEIEVFAAEDVITTSSKEETPGTSENMGSWS